MMDYEMYEEIGCEEYYWEEMPILYKAEDLPAVTYIGKDEWIDAQGQHYIVIE